MPWYGRAAMSLFQGSNGLNELLATGGTGLVVSEVAKVTLGAVIGTLAVLGVIAADYVGDTAFRSARMIIADYIKSPQFSMKRRLSIAIPLFVISIALTQIDFNILWRYFSWANQATAVIALFVSAMYLFIARKITG